MKRLASLLFLAACGTSHNAKHGINHVDELATRPTVAPASERQLVADEKVTTSSEATFTASKGWYLSQTKDGLTVSDPERAATLTIVELDDADGVHAIEHAWQVTTPGFSRKVLRTMKPPVHDGWDELVQVTYETSPAEARVIVAIAQRKGGKQYVFLIDGKQSGFDKRSAQFMTALRSFKAKGVEQESFAGKEAHELDETRLAAFATFVESARKKARVPGVAVAIVSGGHVVFAKGFGERELGKSNAVSPETPFMIGSMTKPLSTLLIAKLVDEKKIDWETPVTSVLPSFALADSEVTKKVLMRHTACACTGMPRRDLEFLFEYDGVTAEDRVASMRTMKPTTGFGETFQYSNLLVAVGGYAAAHAAHPSEKLAMAYEHAMNERVFRPLGMKHSTLAAPDVHAMPHGQRSGGDIVAMPLQIEGGIRSVGPAGAAWSTVLDMSRYLLLELGDGQLDGQRVVSNVNLMRRRQPQVKITDDSEYGLGLMMNHARGIQVVGHGGNTLGFSSDMFFLPAHKVGMVVLTNLSGANRFTRALQRRLLEVLFDGRDEADRDLDFAATASRKIESEEANKVNVIDELTAKAWAGVYRDDDLGSLKVARRGEKLFVDAGEWASSAGLRKNEDGTDSMVLLDPPWAGGLQLNVKKVDGKVTFVLASPQHEYVFRPVP